MKSECYSAKKRAGDAADISSGPDCRSKAKSLPPEENGGKDKSPTRQLDTASPKRLGLRVNCRTVIFEENGEKMLTSMNSKAVSEIVSNKGTGTKLDMD